MTQVYLAGAMARLEAAAKKVVAAVADGDMLRTQMAIVRRLVKHDPVNVIVLQEKIAACVLETGKYVIV
jgi:butyryl-CoA dehydrogenase